jgi:hypothetical protein
MKKQRKTAKNSAKRFLPFSPSFVTIKTQGCQIDGKGVYMTKKIFVEQLTNLLCKMYADTDWQIESDVILKNNDTSKYGIMVRPPGESVSPTIYVDSFYEDYIDKKSTLSEIAEQVMKMMETARKQTSKYEKMAIDYESCKSKIVYRLISLEKNKLGLQNCPYIPFLDLAISFYVICDYTAKGLESLRVTNQLMEHWQIDTKELMAVAEKNTPYHFPQKVESLREILAGYLGQDLPSKASKGEEFSQQLLLVSNQQGINGASVILYKNLIKEIAERYQKNLYIIPSSIHECLIMPEREGTSLSEISMMVKEINHDHVETEDILSDHAYIYRLKDNKFYF